MSACTWPVVTCTACGATGPGRPKVGLCKRCYARAQHPVQPCPGCGQTRRHLAAGLCALCYRLSLTRLVVCPSCGEERPVYFGDRCERCKRRAAARAGACAECGKQVAEIARLGTNLLTVTNGQTFTGTTAELPVAAPGMIGRLRGVTAVQATGTVNGVSVYKSPLIPPIETS